jgi:pyruvate,water dikinase
MKLISAIDLNNCSQTEPKSQHEIHSRLGGKGKNLAFLSQLAAAATASNEPGRQHVRLPQWTCVPPDAFEAIRTRLPQDLAGKLDRLFIGQAEPQAIAETSELISSWITNQPLDSSLIAALESFVTSEGQSEKLFAVRSSALGEDSGANSFAGQFDTFLYVDSKGIADAVRKCFASAFGPRVLAYLLNRGIPLQSLRMSVIIQEMWHSTRSGILFTCNPDGRLDEIAIVAGYGLGEGIVSDQVESDFITVHRGNPKAQVIPQQLDASNTKVIVRNKTEQIIRDPQQSSGTALVPVPASLSKISVLTAEQIRSLCAIALQIEAAAGHPQDIEWGINDAGEVAILQTRPITTIPRGELFLCDNSNVSESYPGISLPLTYDVVRELYSEIFEGFIRSVGVHVTQKQKHSIFDFLVVHVQGRVYYNLSNWYSMLHMVPGTAKFIGVWEEMLGIRQSAAASKTLMEKITTACSSLGTYCSIAEKLITLDLNIKKIHSHFNSISSDFWKIPLNRLTVTELLSLQRDTTHRILRGWEVTLWNDAFTFSFAGLTKYLLTKLNVPAPAALLNDLLGGDAPNEKIKMESAEAIASAARLSHWLASDSSLLELVRERGYAALEAPRPEHVAFSQSFATHLSRFGDRTLNELKLETRTFRQKPEELLALLVTYAENAAALPLHGDTSRYLRSMDSLNAAIKSRKGVLNQLLWRTLMGVVINRARTCMRHRENSRFDRSRAYGIARAITTAIGEKLCSQGIINDTTDVYYLNFSEIKNHVDNRVPITPESIEFKKKHYAQYARSEPLGRFWIRGSQVEGNTIPQEVASNANQQESSNSDNVLTGTGSSPGQVTANALVLDQPRFDCDVKGKILVTRMTDPGWVFLMVNCSGLVSEKGSILSHTAIIGRELGIPTVVGIENATRLIGDGQLITLNGTVGSVQRHVHKPDSLTGSK